MNRLAQEKSSYLKHAANQKIDWYPWSEEAFERARAEGKPVFLSSGAVWCHWCHVMASESFEDDDTALLMNELFINIKLDRDERPDIDRRYQQAVAAMGGGSGWPLSVFLTPEKKPFYGGTYFPLEERQGRPSFKKVLRSVADFFAAKPEDAAAYSGRVMDALKPAQMRPGAVGESRLPDAEAALLAQFDLRNGGFGDAPKFPMPGALEFLIRRSLVSKNPSVGTAARAMLDAMATGGFRDHLGGGFHRYSVDEAWIVPHFEKMADDNAGLLRNYVDGYAVFGDGAFRDVAHDILFFTRSVLADPDGGFYASQDADVTPDDEGGYFTWTEEDFRQVLDAGEQALLADYYLHERGRMHHEPAKNVLFVDEPLKDVARRLGRDPEEAAGMLERGRKKLLAAREEREKPFIDRTFYTSLNGMMIAAYLHAYQVLGGEDIRAFAVRSLERILQERFSPGGLLHTEDVPAVLEDYVHLADALISCYEATAVQRYLGLAGELMDLCLDKFYDGEEGGFFDTDGEVLGTRMKRIEDIPHPSANAVAVRVLLKLSIATGKESYRLAADRTLRIFADLAREIGAHAGSYFCGLDASFNIVKLEVEAGPESDLASAARRLAGKAYTAFLYGADRSRVIPCVRNVCSAPIRDAAQLETWYEGEFG